MELPHGKSYGATNRPVRFPVRQCADQSGTNSLFLSIKRGILWGKLIPAFKQSCEQTALNITCL